MACVCTHGQDGRREQPRCRSHGSRRGSRDNEHIGSAHDDEQMVVLKAAARQRMPSGSWSSTPAWTMVIGGVWWAATGDHVSTRYFETDEPGFFKEPARTGKSPSDCSRRFRISVVAFLADLRMRAGRLLVGTPSFTGFLSAEYERIYCSPR